MILNLIKTSHLENDGVVFWDSENSLFYLKKKKNISNFESDISPT